MKIHPVEPAWKEVYEAGKRIERETSKPDVTEEMTDVLLRAAELCARAEQIIWDQITKEIK